MFDDNTAFGDLDRDSDENVLRRFDSVFRPFDGVDERIKAVHRRDEAAECIVCMKLSSNRTLQPLHTVSACIGIIITSPYLVRQIQDLPGNICVRVKLSKNVSLNGKPDT